MSTELLQNILNEPAELRKSLAYTLGTGQVALRAAVECLRRASTIYITGIGSSWHAGMAVQSIFASAARPAILVDASELLHFTELPPDSVILALSRSGKSVEIVKLLDKAQAAAAQVIGVTNTPDSPLGRRATVRLELHAAFDRNISITMYSALTLVGGLAAAAAGNAVLSDLAAALDRQLAAAESMLPVWQDTVENAAWLQRAVPAYFLARGGSMASASETRLLWEEGAKAPACAMTTGGFRHGPQEILYAKTAVAMWIAETKLRTQDLALLTDLRAQGIPTLAIGRDLPADAADLVLPLPGAAASGPAGWQFLTEIIPGQLAAEALARRRGVDCDNFLYCPYVIESEGGL